MLPSYYIVGHTHTLALGKPDPFLFEACEVKRGTGMPSLPEAGRETGDADSWVVFLRCETHLSVEGSWRHLEPCVADSVNQSCH